MTTRANRPPPPLRSKTIALPVVVSRISVTCTVERGDVLVVEVPTVLTTHQTDRLTALLRKIWPRNRVLILDGGAKLMLGSTAAAPVE